MAIQMPCLSPDAPCPIRRRSQNSASPDSSESMFVSQARGSHHALAASMPLKALASLVLVSSPLAPFQLSAFSGQRHQVSKLRGLRVPRRVGVISGYADPDSNGAPRPTSAKYSDHADIARTLGVEMQGAEGSYGAMQDFTDRPFNFDFVPRLGWRGTVFPSVVSPVLGSIFVSSFVLYLHSELGFPGIDATAHTVLGVLVSFLAVFRTQLAYNRYWEGRGHLGLLMATLVDTASMASVQFSRAEPKAAEAARLEMARLLRIYFRETVRFLRTASSRTQQASNYWLPEDAIASGGTEFEDCDLDLTEDECEALERASRPPVLVLKWIRAHVYRVGVEQKLIAGSDDAARMQTLELGIDRLLSSLQPSFNGAAKIATTPVPQPYTQMSRWLIFAFVYTIPLALVSAKLGSGLPDYFPEVLRNLFGDTSIAFFPAAMLIAFGYYGLDYCASQLQNPFIARFGDAQLDGRFMRAVSEDIDMLLGVPASPEAAGAVTGDKEKTVTSRSQEESPAGSATASGTVAAAAATVDKTDTVVDAGGGALLLDCDGTLVETERDGHRVAFNEAFRQLGFDCEWGVELYGDLVTTGGGKERMTRYFQDYNPAAWLYPEPPSKDHPAILALHKLKTRIFMNIVESGRLQLREGIYEMLSSAKKSGWTIAVCSTSNEKAVQAVVNTNLPEFASSIRVFAGDIVKAKKPDPAIYNLAASELGLDPKKCIVVEDTDIGLRSGKAAGMRVAVTRSIYSANEDFTGADFNVASAAELNFEAHFAPIVKTSKTD